jgi:hypothetical protein
MLIRKDGRVISAHAVAGPPEAYKACEDAVRKWVFKPYFILDKPGEVEQKTECRNNYARKFVLVLAAAHC